jgi:beta-ribofuranosylaminobenzene 5'-phosphate synthase
VTRVTAPSRLHFGLLSLPGDDTAPVQRQFGGVGLMVDRPGLCVRVEAANEWSMAGIPSKHRALSFAKQFVESLPPAERRPFRVVVDFAPTEHQGLGVGTQLGLAVAKAIAVESGHTDWPAVELARRVGRGERSAIGVHGFDRGGLIVEGGKLPGETISALVARYEFPAGWAVALFTPQAEGTWHGGAERDAFARLSPNSEATDRLCRIVLTGLLPALVAVDLDLFGEALYEFNAAAGDAFAAVQGGRYASPAVADCVARLRGLGVRGVGQSSWGPAVFAIARKEDAAGIVRMIGSEFPGLVTGGSGGVSVG